MTAKLETPDPYSIQTAADEGAALHPRDRWRRLPSEQAERSARCAQGDAG